MSNVCLIRDENFLQYGYRKTVFTVDYYGERNMYERVFIDNDYERILYLNRIIRGMSFLVIGLEAEMILDEFDTWENGKVNATRYCISSIWQGNEYHSQYHYNPFTHR